MKRTLHACAVVLLVGGGCVAPWDSTNPAWWSTPLYPETCGDFVGLPDPPFVEELAQFVSVDQVLTDGGFALCGSVVVRECGERWTLFECYDAGYPNDWWSAAVRDGSEIWTYQYGGTECRTRTVGVWPDGLFPCETDRVLIDTR
jgi:hypothetical protein